MADAGVVPSHAGDAATPATDSTTTPATATLKKDADTLGTGTDNEWTAPLETMMPPTGGRIPFTWKRAVAAAVTGDGAQ